MRMIPCIAGCWGPTLTCRFCPPLPVPLPSPRKISRVVVSAMPPSVPRTDQRLPPLDGVVLAQGVPLELLVHQQASEVGVPLEADAEHIPHLSLEPVGDRP